VVFVTGPHGPLKGIRIVMMGGLGPALDTITALEHAGVVAQSNP
jgi:hypothetical protein